MRDLIVLLGFLGTIPFIFMRPAVGVLTWALLGMWNIHRLGYGVARTFPIAALVGAATLASFVINAKDRRPLPWYPPLVVLTILIVHMQITTVFAYDYAYTLPLYSKVMKIYLMTYIAFWLLHTKQHLLWLAGVMTFSMGFYGIKGGIFTVLSGGQSMVMGPVGTFIDANTTMAMALLMTIPYMVFFIGFLSKPTWKNKLIRLGLLGAIGASALATLGSYSRGAFLAGGAMVGFLWMKSKKKAISMVALVLLIPVMISFMPDKFTKRMNTIEGAQENDGSAKGRIYAWIYAWNLAKDYPLTGAGFDGFHRTLWLIYAPPEGKPKFVDAHSNWFQMLGHHGWPGALLFIGLWVANWLSCSWIIRRTKGVPELDWANRLAAMTQVSLIAYFVAGSFLGASYFDFYYYQMVLILGSRRIVEEHLSGVKVQTLAVPSDKDKDLAEEAPEPAPVAPGLVSAKMAHQGGNRRLVSTGLAAGQGNTVSKNMSMPEPNKARSKPSFGDRKDVEAALATSMRPAQVSKTEQPKDSTRRLVPKKVEPDSASTSGKSEKSKLSMLPGQRPTSSWVGQRR